MKRSKSSKNILIAALSMSTIFAASLFAFSPPVAKAQKGGLIQTNATNPVKGIGVVVKKNPGSSARTTQTDSEGSFRVDALEPGSYILVIEIPADSTPNNRTPIDAGLLPQSRSEIRPVGNSAWLGAEGWPYQFSLSGSGVSRKSGSIILQDKVVTDRDTGAARKSELEANQEVTIIEVAFDVTGNSNTNLTGKVTLPTGNVLIKNIKKPN